MWEKEKLPKVSGLDNWTDNSTTYREREPRREPGLGREDHEFNNIRCGHELGRFASLVPGVRRKTERRRKSYLYISSELNQLLL